MVAQQLYMGCLEDGLLARSRKLQPRAVKRVAVVGMKPSMVPKRYCSFDAGLDFENAQQQQSQHPSSSRTPPVARYDSSQRLDKAIVMSRSPVPAATPERTDIEPASAGPAAE